MNEEEDRARRILELAVLAGREEEPPKRLRERIVEQVEYRQGLAQIRAPHSPSRRRVFSVVAVLAAAAAVGALVVRQHASSPPIAAESAPLPASPPRAAAGSALPAGDPCEQRGTATGGAPLIDDFEDGDDAIAPFEARVGLWRWVRDTDAPGTAPALLPIPRPDATPSNQLAVRVKGARLLDWGAAVEFTFRPACYDASKYRGVAFDARGPGRFYVAPRETSVIPKKHGGRCEKDCHNPHVLKIDLGPEWRTYEVRWADVSQRGAGMPPLDPAKINSLAFLIRPEDTPYDVWIDSVRFLQ